MRVSITLGLMFQLLQVRINPHTQTHIYTYNIIIYIYTYIHTLKRHREKTCSFLAITNLYIHAGMHTYIHPYYISFLYLKSFGFPANSQAPAHGCLHELSAASAAVASLSARQPLGADHTPKAPSPTMTKPLSLWFRCYI
jgi:hypothetical protein